MVAARAQIDQQVEGHAATGAERDVWDREALAGTVERDERIGGERVAMLLDEGKQAGGAGFLTHLNQELRIEAKLAAFGDDGSERFERDQVLAFVVHRPAAVYTIAFDRDAPRVEAGAPAFGHGTHDVAMAVDQDGGERGGLDAGADEEGAEFRARVVVELGVEASLLQQWAEAFRAIAAEVGVACGDLA